MNLNVFSVVALVTLCALVGMLLGGAFGYGAGYLAPALFDETQLGGKLEARSAATVLGATVGVLLGGGLGVFAVLVQLFCTWLNKQGRG